MASSCDVLLVENDASDVKFMTRALQKADPKASLLAVADGQQAMTYLSGSESGLPSLILTDLKLPKIHGHQLIEWVRAQPRLAHIPIVALSSSGMKEDIDRAIELGANAYIQKPLGLTELQKIVSSLLATWLNRNSLK